MKIEKSMTKRTWYLSIILILVIGVKPILAKDSPKERINKNYKYGTVEPLPKDAPNIIILYTDEHSFRTLGCYRSVLPDSLAFIWGDGIEVKTPHIDKIANAGVMATSFYCTTPACSPSRSSFMSGFYPQNTPVSNNDIPLDENIVSFAEIMRRSGYTTSYYGKWHLGSGEKPGFAPEKKFGWEDNKYMWNSGHWKKMVENNGVLDVGVYNNEGEPSYALDGADIESYTTDFITTKAINYIDKNKDRPFCVMISYPDPHGPNTVRAPYDTMYSHFDFQIPKTNGCDPHPSWREPVEKKGTYYCDKNMANYFGMVKCIDDNVGRIYKKLAMEGLLENTILVFTSDHGDMLGEFSRLDKGIPLEASAKVPFIISYPRKLPKGTVVNEAMSCVDFTPSILDIIGLKHNFEFEGKSFATLMNEGEDSDWEDLAIIRGSQAGDAFKHITAVSDRYKLIYSNVKSALDVPWFIDMQRDGYEILNFYNDEEYFEIIARMAQGIKDYSVRCDDSAAAPNSKAGKEIEYAIRRVQKSR